MKTRLVTQNLKTILNLMPSGQIALKFDLEHNLLRVCGIDRDNTGFVYTDCPAKPEIQEGDEEYLAKDVIYWPCFMRDKRKGLVELISEIDGPDLTIEWMPVDSKVCLFWKDGKRKRQATIPYIGQPFPSVPTFSYETAIVLPKNARKVFSTHSAVCKNADDDKYQGYWFQHKGDTSGKRHLAYVRSTDKIRMLESEMEIVLPNKGEHLFSTAFPYGVLAALKGRAERIMFDYKNAVFQTSIEGNGQPVILTRVLTKENLPEFDVQKMANRTIVDWNNPPPPHDTTARRSTCHVGVQGAGSKQSFSIAGLMTDEASLTYITPMDVHFDEGWTGWLYIESDHLEEGHTESYTKLYPINPEGDKALGQPGLKCGLSFALVKTVLDLIDDEEYVHIHANPLAPCVFQWDSHTFVIMPMIKRKEPKVEEVTDAKPD